VTQAALRLPEIAAPDALDTLDAMASLASETQAVVHVVSPRTAGIVERARLLAIQANLDVDVDFMPATVRVRFSPKA
jgi:hypothetical protein